MLGGIERQRTATEEGIREEIAEFLKGKPPAGVGIILDGNRRWADRNGLMRKIGHIAGKDKTKRAFFFFEGLPLNSLLWTFSTENWERSDEEKKDLFKLYTETTTNELLPEAIKKNSVIIHYGRKEPLIDPSGKVLIPALPDNLLEALANAEEKTRNNTGQIIGLAINYSGDDEMTRIYERFQKAIQEGLINQNTPFRRDTWHRFSDDNGKMGDLRVLMRTSGIRRQSGFGWRAAYAEPCVIDKMLPDIEPIDFAEGILNALKQPQRFGK